MNELSLHRIYNAGGWQADDFAEGGALRADTVIVEPVRPPRQAEGTLIIGAAEKTDELPPQMCLVYRVLAVGPQTWGEDGEDLELEVGDEVALRNAALDPVHPSGSPLRIHAKHIYRVFPRG